MSAAAILSRSSSVKSGRFIEPKAPELRRVAEPEFCDMSEGGRIGALRIIESVREQLLSGIINMRSQKVWATNAFLVAARAGTY